MRIAILDDDPQQLQAMKQYVQAELAPFLQQSHQVEEFPSGEAFLAKWEPFTYDLIILDIYMDTLTGMDVAYKIRERDDRVLLAFCTSSNEFASESYDVGARYYLRKPINQDSVSRMFKKFDLQHYERIRTVQLPDGHSVMLRSILYTDYDNHVVTVHLNGQAPYKLRTKQSDIEALLPTGDFCVPYKGVTVNFHGVVSISDDTLTLKDGSQVPLTRRKIKEVKDAWKRFQMDQLRKEVRR